MIYLIRAQQLDPVAVNHANSLDLFPQIRESLDDQISNFLPSPQAQLLSGIILGNKKDLPPDLRLALRDTATLHIVVVSGQNLTLLAGFVLGLAGLLRRKQAIFLAFGAILMYTLLTGVQTPVLRAAIMAILAFSAQLFGRIRDGVWILLLTASLMLLFNPYWLFDVSFQLSFLATFGVIVVSPIILPFLKSLPNIIKTDLSVTIASQLMVLPVISANFHQLSLVSVITNSMVLWTIPAIMVLGAVNLILSLLWSPLGEIFAVLSYIPLTYFIYVVKFFASLPFAWQYIGDLGWLFWIGYYFLLAALFVLLLNHVKKTT